MKYKFVSHTADIKFFSYGKTIEEVFENSAYALVHSISDKKINGNHKIKFHVNGIDFENLMYNFLEEFLFLFDSKNLILSRIYSIKIDKKNFTLHVGAFFDDGKNHRNLFSIKAVTYSEMKIQKKNGKWSARVVLDI